MKDQKAFFATLIKSAPYVQLQFLLGGENVAPTRWTKRKMYASNGGGTRRSRLDNRCIQVVNAKRTQGGFQFNNSLSYESNQYLTKTINRLCRTLPRVHSSLLLPGCHQRQPPDSAIATLHPVVSSTDRPPAPVTKASASVKCFRSPE